MSRSKLNLALCLAMLTMPLAAATDKKVTPVRASQSCTFMVRASWPIIESVYHQSGEIWQERRAQAMAQGVSANQVQPTRQIRSEIASLDRVFQSAYTIGGTVEPLLPQSFLERLYPEEQLVAVGVSGAFKLNFSSACNSRLVSDYRNLLKTESEIYSVEEEPKAEIMGGPTTEIISPINRPAPNDADFSKQWDRSCTGQTISVPSNRGGSSFTCKQGSDINYLTGELRPAKFNVIIIDNDTGLYRNHPDFDKSRILDDLYGFSANQDPKDLADRHGHGTHTAGTYLQTTGNNLFGAGSLYQKNIFHVTVKIFPDDGSGSTGYSQVLMGVLWTQHINTQLKKEGKSYLLVSSNSWGFVLPGARTTDLPELKTLILNQLNAGIPFVAAAGNAGNNNDLGYNVLPAAWAREFYRKTKAPMIVVGATDFNGNRPPFSGWGPLTVSVGAPGHPIYSTLPPASGVDRAVFGSDNLYAFWSGTSMSTPKVAEGAVELMVVEGEAPYPQMQDRIAASSSKPPGLYGYFAGGILNLYELLMADNQLPGVPSNFKIEKVTFDSITFSFDRPHDVASNGSPRNVESYNVWVSYQKLDERNFMQGSRLVLWSNPTSEREIATIVGLKSGTSTSIVVEAIDKGGNSSVAPAVFATTNPLHTLWLEYSLTGGFAKENGWEFLNTGPIAQCQKCPVMWHKYQPTSEEAGKVSADLVYQVEGQNNLNTLKYGYKENEGRAISPWIGPLPKDAVLSMVSSRHTGLWILRQRADGTRHWEFNGDNLALTVYRKGKPSVKIADLPGSYLGSPLASGAWVNENFSLAQFEGEEIKLVLDFKFSERSYNLGYFNFSGVRIAKLQVVGTRDDTENLPVAPNGGFEKVIIDSNSLPVLPRSRQHKEVAQEPPRFAEGWTRDEHICSNCKDDDWFVMRVVDGKAPQGLAFLRLNNKIRDQKSWVITTSDKFKAKPGLYQLDQLVKLDGVGTVIIISYDKNGQENGWLVSQDLSDSGGDWKSYSMPFKVPETTGMIAIRFGLKGKDNTISTLDLDDVRVDFLSRKE